MRLSLTIILFLASIITSELAQAKIMMPGYFGRHTRVTFKLGADLSAPNLALPASGAKATKRFKFGPMAGFGVDHSLTKDERSYLVVPGTILGIGFDALFTRRGYIIPNEIDVTLDTITLPVYLRIDMLRFLQLSGGVFFGYRIGMPAEKIPNGTTSAAEFSNTDLNKEDFGWVFGAAALWPFRPDIRKYMIGVRYYMGTKNLYETPVYSHKTRTWEAYFSFFL